MKYKEKHGNSLYEWHAKVFNFIDDHCYLSEEHIHEILYIKNNIEYFNFIPNHELIFAIPKLSSLLTNIREHILKKTGYYILKGFPIKSLDMLEIKFVYQILGKLLGNLLPQNQNKEYVVDVYNAPKVNNSRGYLSNEELDFHTDACDIIGLLCINQAEIGGLSKIVSSPLIYGKIHSSNPKLVKIGFTPFKVKIFENINANTHGHYHSIPVYTIENNSLLSRLVPGYTKLLLLENKLSSLQKKQLELLENIQFFANDPSHYLSMKLSPGDIQFLNNNTIYHTRTSFKDGKKDKRHMLRIWIDIPEIKSYPNLFLS